MAPRAESPAGSASGHRPADPPGLTGSSAQFRPAPRPRATEIAAGPRVDVRSGKGLTFGQLCLMPTRRASEGFLIWACKGNPSLARRVGIGSIHVQKLVGVEHGSAE